MVIETGIAPNSMPRLHDSYLDELLPPSLRLAALRAQPGDVLKLQSERGVGDRGRRLLDFLTIGNSMEFYSPMH